MGKLRRLSGKEACAILAQSGFIEVRRRGSHVVMQKRVEGRTITVPVPDHPVLTVGTLAAVIRQPGVPRVHLED